MDNLSKKLFLIPAFVIFLGASPTMAACQKGPFQMSLPAERMGTRLQNLAHLTGCAVDVDDAIIAGKRTKALNGSFTSFAAFRRSLKGTALKVVRDQGHFRVYRP